MRSEQRDRQSSAAAEHLLATAEAPLLLCGVARYGLLTEETDRGGECSLVPRDELLNVLRKHAQDQGDDRGTCAALLAEVEAHPGEIPHIIQWEAGTELEFFAPLDAGGDA